jgi:hypothetical protein
LVECFVDNNVDLDLLCLVVNENEADIPVQAVVTFQASASISKLLLGLLSAPSWLHTASVSC